MFTNIPSRYTPHARQNGVTFACSVPGIGNSIPVSCLYFVDVLDASFLCLVISSPFIDGAEGNTGRAVV